MAIPVIESTADTNLSEGTSASVTVPSGVVADDIILLFIALDDSGHFPEAAGDGFAQLYNDKAWNIEVEGSCLWKRATGADSGTYSVTWTTTTGGRCTAVRVSGCVTSGDPWDVISATVKSNGGTTNPLSRLTSTVIDTLALYGLFCDRNRIKVDDTITGTGWTEVGISGNSDGAGNITAENDMPSIGQVEAGTFGTWLGDENFSKGFNLIGVSGTLFSRTASQTITISNVNPRIYGANRTAAQTITHSQTITRVGILTRAIAQTITHSEVITELRAYSRTISQSLTHSESIAQLGTYARVVAQTITESDSVVRVKGLVRTASQTITHSESIARVGVFARVVAQGLTHSTVINIITTGILAAVRRIVRSKDPIHIKDLAVFTTIIKVTATTVLLTRIKINANTLFNTKIKVIAGTIKNGIVRVIGNTVIKTTFRITGKTEKFSIIPLETKSEGIVRKVLNSRKSKLDRIKEYLDILDKV